MAEIFQLKLEVTKEQKEDIERYLADKKWSKLIKVVLVTGASGFIASHIVKQLQEEGYRVRGTVPSLQDEDKVKQLNELCPEAQFKLELVEADLTKPESWDPAVKDVSYVIHVASPVPSQGSKEEADAVNPVVEGTNAVLKACVTAKSVKRVVMTSSSVAIGYGPASLSADPNKVFTEEDWTDPEKLDAYGKSKTLAEKAAWDYVKELPDEDKIELAVINPSYVMGPVINGSQCSSMEILKRLLEREKPMLPKLNFNIVDVRDVAAAHIKAMTIPEAAGKRHLVVNNNMWMKEIAQILSKEFKPQGYSVPTMNYPNPLLKFNSLFDASIKHILPNVGKVYKFDNNRMKDVLQVTPRESKETILEMAYSLIEGGLVKKSKKYKGPGGDAAPEGEQKEGEGEKKEGEKEEEKPKENGEVKEEKDGEVKKEEEKKEMEPEDKDEAKTEESKPEEKKEEEKSEEKTEEKKEEKTEETTEEKKEEK